MRAALAFGLAASIAVGALGAVAAERDALGAWTSHGGPSGADAEMRALVAEYQQFKGSAEFRRLGFSARGPFAAWSERVQELQDRPGYAASLLSRCDVVPLDLWNAGADAYSSRATAWRVGIEAKFAACFRR